MFAGLPDCAARSQMTDVQLDDAITTYTALAATVAAHRLLFIAEKTSRTYTDDYDTRRGHRSRLEVRCRGDLVGQRHQPRPRVQRHGNRPRAGHPVAQDR
ncbi:hypothetical protein [Mycolicibacterium tokaiense]|uniref:hypothetical protein n=1 Tax=Mycolicibacterium tokaiense TaxID=39695 RepID=UPI00138C25A1|nr:hypothetical protein [Mycolicibacterium tokaiense]BBY85256.1 hypothetical protein MTOK_10380 [Mycolicibacterium tokaiense]